MILFEAFLPRRRDKGQLSMNWLEVFSTTQWVALHCIRCFYGKVFTLEHNGRFVVLNVQQVKDVIMAAGNVPTVVSAPTAEDPSHTLVGRVEHDPMQVATDLVTELAALANERGTLARALSSG